MTAPTTKRPETPAAPTTRNTVQRALVLEAVRTLHDHPTSADVYEEVRLSHPNISRATVYRNLNVLAERGELQRVEVPNGADRFDVRAEPHYHLKCEACGRIFDADVPYRDELTSQAGETHGFQVTGHSILFTGLCAECRAAAQEAARRG